MNVFNSLFFTIGQLRIIALAAACLAVTTAPLRAGDAVHYRGSPVGSKVRIDGSSNIHDWVMDGQIIAGYFELPAGVVFVQAEAVAGGGTGGGNNAPPGDLCPCAPRIRGTNTTETEQTGPAEGDCVIRNKNNVPQ